MIDIIFQEFFNTIGQGFWYLPLVGYVGHAVFFTIIDRFL